MPTAMGTKVPQGITQCFHPAEVTFPPLPQLIKSDTHLATKEGCKTKLT